MLEYCVFTLTCCCWDWWPWASACHPSPQAKTPACWNVGTAQLHSSSCPSVRGKKPRTQSREPTKLAVTDGQIDMPHHILAHFHTHTHTYIYTLACIQTSGGSCIRKLWSAAKVRMLTHWPTEEGKASISLKLQSSSSRDVKLMQTEAEGS